MSSFKEQYSSTMNFLSSDKNQKDGRVPRLFCVIQSSYGNSSLISQKDGNVSSTNHDEMSQQKEEIGFRLMSCVSVDDENIYISAVEKRHKTMDYCFGSMRKKDLPNYANKVASFDSKVNRDGMWNINPRFSICRYRSDKLAQKLVFHSTNDNVKDIFDAAKNEDETVNYTTLETNLNETFFPTTSTGSSETEEIPSVILIKDPSVGAVSMEHHYMDVSSEFLVLATGYNVYVVTLHEENDYFCQVKKFSLEGTIAMGISILNSENKTLLDTSHYAKSDQEKAADEVNDPDNSQELEESGPLLFVVLHRSPNFSEDVYINAWKNNACFFGTLFFSTDAFREERDYINNTIKIRRRPLLLKDPYAMKDNNQLHMSIKSPPSEQYNIASLTGQSRESFTKFAEFREKSLPEAVFVAKNVVLVAITGKGIVSFDISRRSLSDLHKKSYLVPYSRLQNISIENDISSSANAPIKTGVRMLNMGSVMVFAQIGMDEFLIGDNCSQIIRYNRNNGTGQIILNAKDIKVEDSQTFFTKFQFDRHNDVLFSLKENGEYQCRQIKILEVVVRNRDLEEKKRCLVITLFHRLKNFQVKKNMDHSGSAVRSKSPLHKKNNSTNLFCVEQSLVVVFYLDSPEFCWATNCEENFRAKDIYIDEDSRLVISGEHVFLPLIKLDSHNRKRGRD